MVRLLQFEDGRSEMIIAAIPLFYLQLLMIRLLKKIETRENCCLKKLQYKN